MLSLFPAAAAELESSEVMAVVASVLRQLTPGQARNESATTSLDARGMLVRCLTAEGAPSAQLAALHFMATLVVDDSADHAFNRALSARAAFLPAELRNPLHPFLTNVVGTLVLVVVGLLLASRLRRATPA
jgi:hypothetical protein